MVKKHFDFNTFNKTEKKMKKNTIIIIKPNFWYSEKSFKSIYFVLKWILMFNNGISIINKNINHSFHRNFAHRFSRNKHPMLSSAQNRSHLQLKKSSDLNPSLTFWKKKSRKNLKLLELGFKSARSEGEPFWSEGDSWPIEPPIETG